MSVQFSEPLMLSLQRRYTCAGSLPGPPHRDIQKTALGATESVAWKYFTETSDAVRELKDKGYKIIGIEQTERSVGLQDMHVNKGEKYVP